VSRHCSFDIAVLGGGPAGLMAALAATKIARTVLVLDRLPRAEAPFRIDAVPARTLALLADFGIDPRAIGADTLSRGQNACWETETPLWSDAAPTAHIERPLLECALFDALCADHHAEIVVDRARPYYDRVFGGSGWQAKMLIDATGRAAVTAASRIRLQPAWAGRFYWTKRSAAAKATPEFRIVALPHGYAYRLGSARNIGIGLVGRSQCLNVDLTSAPRDMHFLFEDMPALALMKRGVAGVASVQWSIAGRAALVGDASIARDALSSQGLAASLSDGLYAVAAIGSGDSKCLPFRQAENLSTHLRLLKQQIARCRYRAEPTWRAYNRVIDDRNKSLAESREAPALWRGRIEELPLDT
jgi:2-polyprenyl-6-methoxyphenol hydroxylase-like FAD-dependent oxidoreductase